MKISLKKKFLFTTILPILLLGLVVIIITMTRVKSSMVNEIRDSLRGTAAAALAAYNQNSGEYLETENGDVWKGSYNISKSETLVDSIKQESGMDVTFFYGTRRIMTSALDAGGNRILGSPAGDVIVEKVLKGGEEYFSRSVSLDGTLCYGYYVPVFQKGDSSDAVGMLFVGTDKAAKDAAINRILYLVVIAVLLITLVCLGLAFFMAGSVTGALQKSIHAVETVATGQLNVEIAPALLKRNDEIADLSVAIVSLRDELTNVISQIAQNAGQLSQTSALLGTTARDTNQIMQQVEQAVGSITETTQEQAVSTQEASDHVLMMGEQISMTSREVASLGANADVMRRSSQQAAGTIRQLMETSRDVEQAIEAVTRQTNQTNESVKKIQEATEIIAAIAEETNLLSLNASIEAARAGESGRGFAVVAQQIQKLAEQSNESSHTIEEITRELMHDSQVAVDAMQRMRRIVDNQSRNMIETESIVGEVMGGINISLKSIEQIESTTVQLEDSRNEIVRTVENLTEIAQQNAASTQETQAQTTEVADTFAQLEQSAQQLREIAQQLSGTMQTFRLS